MSNSSQSDCEDSFNRRHQQEMERRQQRIVRARIIHRMEQVRRNPYYRSPDAQPIIEQYMSQSEDSGEDSGYLSRQETPIIMNNWERHFPSPIHEPSPPPQQYNVMSSPDLLPELESPQQYNAMSSPDSPYMLIPRAYIRFQQPSPTYDEIQFGELINTTQSSDQPSLDWSDDGNNEQLNRLMDKYDEINELLLKKT